MKFFLFTIVTIFNIVLSVVEIEGPSELITYFKEKTKKDKIPSSYAHFGRIPYGHQISGRLYYDSFNLDYDIACKQMNNFTGMPKPEVDKNPILLIDRGNCTFVRKVKNVEKTGAKAAIIVNNVPGDVSDFMMMDDGSGSDILIPAVMISKEDGRVIQEFYKDNINNSNIISSIRISINFDMLKQRKARIDIFYTSSNFKVYDLFRDFAKYQESLEHKDIIYPHLVSFPHYLYNPTNNKTFNNCLSYGRYCADPILDKGITSEDIIFENIRQLCIDKVGRKENNDLYYKYILKFESWCRDIDFTTKCAESIIDSEMSYYKENILKCMNESFSSDNKINYILNDEIKKLRDYNMLLFPSILVNNRTFSSSWTAENLLEAVCSGVIARPEICFKSGMFDKESKERTGMSAWTILLVIAIIIVLNVLIYLCCKRYIVKSISERVSSDEIDNRINSVVASYIAFKDQEKK